MTCPQVGGDYDVERPTNSFPLCEAEHALAATVPQPDNAILICIQNSLGCLRE